MAEQQRRYSDDETNAYLTRRIRRSLFEIAYANEAFRRGAVNESRFVIANTDAQNFYAELVSHDGTETDPSIEVMYEFEARRYRENGQNHKSLRLMQSHILSGIRCPDPVAKLHAVHMGAATEQTMQQMVDDIGPVAIDKSITIGYSTDEDAVHVDESVEYVDKDGDWVWLAGRCSVCDQDNNDVEYDYDEVSKKVNQHSRGNLDEVRQHGAIAGLSFEEEVFLQTESERLLGSLSPRTSELRMGIAVINSLRHSINQQFRGL